MAIYHYRVGFVSRSTGRSAVQSAAYITGNKLEESRRDITADYRNRSSDVIFSATFAPKHAPEYMKTLDVWNTLESYEDQYAMRFYRTEATQEKYKSCAQVAQTTVVALPKEIAPEVWKELVTDFVNERFVNRGLIATVAIHNDEGNPHAHFQISRRAVTDKGEWSLTKDREITTKSALLESRRLWAEKTNQYLAREGHEIRVDHRSYADMGIPFEPTKHENWYAHKLEKSGLNSRIIQEKKEIKNRNKEYLGLNPGEILKELTSKQATFSTLELAKLIQNRLGDDPKLASYVYESSLSQASIVGVGLDGQTRYTSQDYLQLEQQALDHSRDLMSGNASLKIDPILKEATLNSKYNYLNDEQLQSVKILCDDAQLNVLIGRAGTGKTTTLKAVVDLHKQSGYKIHGLALSAVAAENLALEADCNAETVAFYLDKWDQREKVYQKFWSIHSSSEHPKLERKLHELDRYNLTEKHLVIVDEAGMLGTSQWAAILQNVQKANAKLIVVGDDHQFKAIEAGDLFRKIKETAIEERKLSSLTSIIRQKEEWMRDASKDLAELKTYQALASYDQQGHIKKIEIADLKLVAESYVQKRISTPDEGGLLLASTRSQCQILNDETRKILKEENLISQTDFQINGRSFSIGDEIIFLKNDREKLINCLANVPDHANGLLVKNGTRGKIIDIKEIQNPLLYANKQAIGPFYQMTVEIDKNTVVSLNTKDYHHFDHSYSITLHKAQGQTVDWSMIVASKNMDAHATYVALTRHRKDVTLFYDKQTFNEFKDLQKSLSRVSNKDLVIDYTIRPEHQQVWRNIQEYILLGQDLASSAKETDWTSYHALKKDRDALGQNILSEWKEHFSYAHQAGLSKESIEIACGLKMRPLSLIEEQARLKVQGYASKAMKARLLWLEIRKTHPGSHCYEHSKYSEFTKIRQERNQIANEIINNRPLYKEFISELSQNLNIGWKTLNSQSRQWNDNLSHEYLITNYPSKNEISRIEGIPLIDIAYASKILDKYNLYKPNRTTDEAFISNIKALYERMVGWNKVLGISNTDNENHKLSDKAIITEVIKSKAKSEYCFLSTPFETAIRSEGIALLTADLLQQQDNKMFCNKLLDQGAKLYDNQKKYEATVLLQEHQNNYPNTAKSQLETLVDQQFLCKNMIGKELSQKALDNILNAKMVFDSILPSTSSGIKQELEASIGTLIEKEKESVVLKVLERGFVDTFLKDRHEHFSLPKVLDKSPYAMEAKERVSNDLNKKMLVLEKSRGNELEL